MTTKEQELETQALSIPDRAIAIEIATNEDYERAGELLKTIKGLRGQIAETFDPIIKKQHEAHKVAIEAKKKVDAPLDRAEVILKPKLAGYLIEQEEIRKAEELRLQRQAQEEEEKRQIENAVILDDLGETEAANALLEEPVTAAPVILPRTAPKVSGVAPTKRYSAVITSLADLVKAVAAGRVPLLALKADEVFLNQQARSMREQLNYPGVRVHIENGISARK